MPPSPLPRTACSRDGFHDQQFDLDGVYEVYLSGIPDGEAKTNGIQVGEEVGLGMLQIRSNDGLDTIVPYLQRAPGPGVYEPTAPVHRLEHGCRTCCPWPWTTHLDSGHTDGRHCAAGNTHTTSTK